MSATASRARSLVALALFAGGALLTYAATSSDIAPAGIVSAADVAQTNATLSPLTRQPASAKVLSTSGDTAVRSIRAKDGGVPRISYSDGVDLVAAEERTAAGVGASVLASADFDSDGIPDVITVDSRGAVKLYRGNPDTLYPHTDEANARRAAGTFSDAPFYSAVSLGGISTSPDHLAAGDFNGDGHADILAARNGESVLHLLVGNGAGAFADDHQIQVDGSITALSTGEVGRRDGQTDVAVAVLGSNGASLVVFEHPEGAFKHTPEIVSLLGQTDVLAIGHLDTDYLGDIATASGNKLTVVRGRGQAFPWDAIEGYDIARPAPIVETRAMPSNISALTVGQFTKERGESLAILTTDGAIRTLDSPAAENRVATFKAQQLQTGDVSLPAKDSRLSKYSSFSDFAPSADASESQETLFKVENGSVVPLAPVVARTPKLNAEQEAALASGETAIIPESRERSKAGFLRSISPRPAAPLAQWTLQTIASDARLTSAANSGSPAKLIKVRASDSGRDELAVVDASSNQLHVMSRDNVNGTDAAGSQLASFDVASAPTAVLPMRLNADAISDLVVLREDSAAPSIVMSAPANTFVVNTSSDEDDGTCGAVCSLREAINAANAAPGADLITFSTGPAIIQPESSLPQIDFAVTIDGGSGGGHPYIEIKGNLAEEGANGLSVNAANVVVRGLVINEFRTLEGPEGDTGGSGISIYNFSGETQAGSCIIENNYLGTDRTGSLDRGNEQAGLFIFDSDGNLVGGTNAAARNVISGNGNGEQANGNRFGPGIRIVDGGFTTVQGNYVGVTASGSSRLSNSAGIVVSGANNEIGGDAAGAGNVVSGNRHSAPTSFDPQGCYGEGIGEQSVINEETGEWVTRNSNYKGNRIGVNAAGNAAIGNCRTGLSTSPRNTATIGSITAAGRNTISGNNDGGLFCTTGSRGAGFGFRALIGGTSADTDDEHEIPEGSCKITGNNVGTDVTGSFAIPNDHSRGDQIVRFFGALVIENTATFSTVGGHPGTSANSCTGHCNLVSGNADAGITRHRTEGDVGIWNNYIGTNKNGTGAVGNESGVSITGNTNLGGYFTSSGTDFSFGNLISGNRRSALNVSSLGSEQQIVQIRGNLIGTDVSGLTALPNNTAANASTGQAVSLFGSPIVLFGGTHPLERNVISGNFGSGVVFGSGVLSAATINNYIGVNKNGQPLGNGMDGVELRGSFDYFGDAGVGNVIANNGRNGVFVQGTAGNRLRFNSIYNNGALGIDLTADTTAPRDPDGVTPNDCLDADTGPNDLQNYPVLTAPSFNQNGTVTVGGALISKASQTYTLDFYSNSAADPSNYGEGQTYIGSTTVTTDSSGKTAFQFTSQGPVASGLKITATATDSNGNTSEFSCVAGACPVQRPGTSEMSSAIDAATDGCAIGLVVNITTDQPDPNPADGICDVDLNTTGEQCSLRAAIQTTNAVGGTDFINFDIPGGSTPVISATSSLPAITEKVLINGASQPGYNGSRPGVEVKGAPGMNVARGFTFAAGSDGSSLTALSVHAFDEGVVIESNDNRIERCHIGADAAGLVGDPAGESQLTGVIVRGSGNQIGGANAGNLLSGNLAEQLVLRGAGATGNKVIGNLVGFDVMERTTFGAEGSLRGTRGILIADGASENTIGGENAGEGNDITANLAGIEVRRGSKNNTFLRNSLNFSPVGIAIRNSSDNQVGGELGANADESKGNFFDRNEVGIAVDDENPKPAGAARAANNKLFGNVFVVFDPENAPIDRVGILVGVADDTLIGSDQPGFANAVLDNSVAGVIVRNEAVRTVVQGNFIGVNAAGTRRPNKEGIRLAGFGTVVRNNVISGNTESGVAIDRLQNGDAVPSGNTISNNRIGTNDLGTAAIPNETGITVDGNLNSITANIISGNTAAGVAVSGNQNSVSQNQIGTNLAGSAAIGSQTAGLAIEGSANTVAANTISGHSNAGIIVAPLGQVSGTPTGNIIRGNRIGTNSAGTSAIPNLAGGIVVSAANNTLIGGFGADMPAARNIVSGNTGHGIGVAAGALQTRISGNYIGTAADGSSALGNSGNGIFLQAGVGSTKIGGLEANAGNTIAYNGSNGILLAADAGNNNIIDPNRIFANGLLGIDLRGDGRTPNDLADADEGPNRLQNYPEILAARVNANNQLVVSYAVPSAPAHANYGANGIYIEFFVADAASAGARFVGSDHYTVADHSNGTRGAKEINLGDIGAIGFSPASDKLTATATDADGNTSEFLGWSEVQFQSASQSTQGAEAVTITVTRAGTTIAGATVDYATVPGGTATGGASCAADVDFISTSGTLTFAAGEKSKTFSVPVCANGSATTGDTIHLALSNPTGVSLGSPSAMVLTISAAPPAPPTAFSAGGPPPDVATVGHPYAGYTFIANGSPRPTYKVQAGTLPDGFSLSDDGKLTAANPTAPGTFSGIVVRASNASGFLDTAPFTITVNPAIAFTTTTLPEWVKDKPDYNQTVAVTGGTGTKTLAVTSGSLPPGLSFDANSGAITGTPTEANSFTFTVTATDSLGAKTEKAYTIVIKPAADASPTPSPTASPSPSPTPAPTKLLNISTRLNVQTGENVLIGGIIITGSEPKKMILRAIGPSLAAQGVEGALQDPVLELFDGAGEPVATNDNWRDAEEAEVEASTIPPGDNAESALVRTLAPGNYTAVVSGKGNTTGIGLVEVYDLAQSASSQLANISSRGFVETGANALIGGFITGGPVEGTPARVVVRALGPSLGDTGVSGALADPTLELVDANGSTLLQNNDWRAGQSFELEALNLQPTRDEESALIATLPAGNYTAVVRGNGDTTGIGLVEVYNVP